MKRDETHTLLPCPFCSDAATVCQSSHPRGGWYGMCDGCATCGPSAESYDDAIAAWNRRAPHTPDEFAEKYDFTLDAAKSDIARLIECHDAFDCPDHLTFPKAAGLIANDLVERFGKAFIASPSPAASSQERIAQLEARVAEAVKMLGRIRDIAYHNYGRQNEKMADIEPLCRRFIAALAEAAPAPEGEWIDRELVDRLRRLVDGQEGGDAVVLVQRQLFNKVVGRLSALSRAAPARMGAAK